MAIPRYKVSIVITDNEVGTSTAFIRRADSVETLEAAVAAGLSEIMPKRPKEKHRQGQRKAGQT